RQLPEGRHHERKSPARSMSRTLTRPAMPGSKAVSPVASVHPPVTPKAPNPIITYPQFQNYDKKRDAILQPRLTSRNELISRFHDLRPDALRPGNLKLNGWKMTNTATAIGPSRCL